MNIEYRAPRNQAELDDSIQCSVHAFNGGEHLFTNIVKSDPWFDFNNTRACFLDGRIASVVQIFDRPMRMGDCIVRMGGIGSVGTRPDYRRGGYSSGVLRDSVRYMQDAGYDLSILFTGIPSHYARAGWVIYPAYSIRLRLPETIGAGPDGVEIQQCQPDRDLPALQAIYDRFNANRTGTIVRTVEYWNNQPRWRGYDPSLFWIAKQDDVTVAYLKASQWELREFGYLPDAKGAMIALFRHFFRQAKADDVNEISAPTPLACRTLFEQMGCAVRRREGTYRMIQIINIESLLTKIQPLFAARLEASDFSGWTGAIRIRYEAGEQTLSVQDGRFAFAPGGQPPSIDLVVSQTQLLKLLFGNMNAEQVAFCNGLTFKEDEIGLLNALFPPDELFLWETDAF